MACMFYFTRCINIIFNLLLTQLVKYDVYTTRKIESLHAIFYHILLFYTTCMIFIINNDNAVEDVAYVCCVKMLRTRSYSRD